MPVPAHPRRRPSRRKGPRMRPSPRALAALLVLAAVSLTPPAARSATAQEDSSPSATVAAPSTERQRLNVRVGRAAVVTGRAAAGRTVVLERRRRERWRTLDRDRVDP